jgi:GNAT superfamily N-acetyltransferase
MQLAKSAENKIILEDGSVYKASIGGIDVCSIIISRSASPVDIKSNWETYSHTNMPAAYIYNLEVSEHHRKIGIGTQMLCFAESAAFENGLYLIRLNSNSKDRTLTSFYLNRDYELLKKARIDYFNKSFNFFQKDLRNPEKRIEENKDLKMLIRRLEIVIK